MYMNISTFRQTLKEQFDNALVGPVHVTRGGVTFELRVLREIGEVGNVKTVNVVNLQRATEPFIARGGSKIDSIPVNEQRYSNGLCKVHQLPLDGRGRCLQKGCKFS